MSERDFTVGIEEEYLIVDRESRDLIQETPNDLMDACKATLGDQVSPEFLQSQVEVGTRVSGTIAEAGRDLTHLRKTVAEEASRCGYGLIAASTHPFAQWDAQRPTDRDRYHTLARDLQGVVRRLVICGMHVHVAIHDEDLRVDLMNQAAYFLPHILALTTSSPFWRGDDTGLMSYRLSVFDNLPRTGLPNRMESWVDWQRHVDVLVRAGVIEDATKIWWDLRPSARFPTLELRICDVATRLADALAAAALFQSVLHMLKRLRRNNQTWRIYGPMFVRENRWRAQRYGVDEGLIDFGKGAMVPFGDLLEELLSLVEEDAEALGCTAELAHARTIISRGTSAHAQRRAYEAALAAGADRQEALAAVVDLLINETVADLA